MTEPRPIYGGEVGENGQLLECKCGALGTYEITCRFQGIKSTFPVCTKHFRFFSRTQPVRHFKAYKAYESWIRRVDVWRKRNE